MLIRMTRDRTWQDIGRELALLRDQAYDLPATVALALVRQGVAVVPAVERREMAVTGPVETKVRGKRGRR